MAPPLPNARPPPPQPTSSSHAQSQKPQIQTQPHGQPQRSPSSPSNSLKRPSLHIQSTSSSHSHSNGFLKPTPHPYPFPSTINASTAYISPLTASPVDNGVKRRKFDEYTSTSNPTPLTATLITPHSSLSTKPPARLRNTEISYRSQLATPSPTPSPGFASEKTKGQADALRDSELDSAVAKLQNDNEDGQEEDVLENTDAITAAIEEVEEEVDAEDSELEEPLQDEDDSEQLIASWPSAILAKALQKERPIMPLPKTKLADRVSCFGRENWDREAYLALLRASVGL